MESSSGLQANRRGFLKAHRRSELVSCQFEFYGTRVRVISPCQEFLGWVERDFRFFLDPSDPAPPPDVEISFHKGSVPSGEAAVKKRPTFRVGPHTVFDSKVRRVICHKGLGTTIYDLRSDRGRVYAEKVESLYQIAYLLILSRVGCRLDRIGVHRFHALALSHGGSGLLFLARSGCGKTTLGLEMMGFEEFNWLADEIPLLDRDGLLRPFPLPPRLDEQSPMPAVYRESATYPVPRSKRPPKVMVDVGALLSRVESRAEPRALFLCRRKSSGQPRIRRIGTLRAFLGMVRNCVVGEEFPQSKAFFFEFRLRYALSMAPVFFSRVRRFFRLARELPSYRFEMRDDRSENVRCLLTMLSKDLNLEAAAPEELPGPDNQERKSSCLLGNTTGV